MDFNLVNKCILGVCCVLDILLDVRGFILNIKCLKG